MEESEHLDYRHTENTDLAKGLFIEKWPHWVRWLLVIPAALIVPIVVVIIQRLAAVLFGGGDTPGIFAEIISNVILGGGIVIVGAATAPRAQFLVGTILLVLVSLLGLLAFVGGAEDHLTMAVMNGVSVVGAGIYALYLIHKIEKGEEV